MSLDSAIKSLRAHLEQKTYFDGQLTLSYDDVSHFLFWLEELKGYRNRSYSFEGEEDFFNE